MHDLKIQDMKMADQIAGHKNAQPENETHGSCYARLQFKVLHFQSNPWMISCFGQCSVLHVTILYNTADRRIF